MNHLEKTYCQECDYNNLEICFKKFKISKDIKKINDKSKNHNFIPISINLLPEYCYNLCTLCNNNHKTDKCPLLLDNIYFNQIYNIKNKNQIIKSIIKKPLNKKSTKSNIDFDICNQLSNLNIKLTNKKRVKFNLTTTH